MFFYFEHNTAYYLRSVDCISNIGSSVLLPLAAFVGAGNMRAKADRLALQAVADDLFQAGKGAARDEQYVGRIDLQKFLLGMLAPALRRHARGRAFHQLEQRLLHALARYVAGDRKSTRLNSSH